MKGRCEVNQKTMKTDDQPPPLPKTRGTPKTLEDAVIASICFRPPEGTQIDQYVRDVFRDFMAQKFGVALLKAHTIEQRAMLAELWQQLTGEKPDWGNE